MFFPCARKAILKLLVLVYIIGFSVDVTGQDLFTDVSALSKASFLHTAATDTFGVDIGTGAVWFDFDRDGDLDLYVTDQLTANHLMRNSGDGTFEEITLRAGVADTSGYGGGASVADYDNDGFLDIYVANGREDVLFHNNGDTTFTDVTAVAFGGSPNANRGMTASWGDYDADGFLDLYIANHQSLDSDSGIPDSGPHNDVMYHNNGDGTFTDVSSLLDDSLLDGLGFIGGWSDVDVDFDMDLILINDCPYGPDSTKVFRNDGGIDPVTDWSFREVSKQANASKCENGMGLAVGDYDRDGDFDLFYTNIKSAVLLNNQGDGTFADSTEASGLKQDLIPGKTSNRITWGTTFLDFNLDGWIDLYVAAGEINKDANQIPQPNILYQNDGNGLTFTDVSDLSATNDSSKSRTVVFGDYDNDGDPDLYVINFGRKSKLFRNDNSNGNHWLQIELEGVASNRDGLGSRVKVTTPDGVSQFWETRSGSSLGGGDDIAANFGLGDQTLASRVEIRWPSGIVQIIDSIAVDQRIKIVEEVPMPVELVSFDAYVDGANVVLKWNTNREINNAGFEIYQDDVTKGWEKIGWLSGKGTTDLENSYQFKTKNLSAGRHRFRLRQFDKNGSSYYLPITEIWIDLPDAFELSTVYPNPFTEKTFFKLMVAEPQHVTVEVYNMVGQRVAKLHDAAMMENKTELIQFDGTGLASGVYLIKVTGQRFVTSKTAILVR